MSFIQRAELAAAQGVLPTATVANSNNNNNDDNEVPRRRPAASASRTAAYTLAAIGIFALLLVVLVIVILGTGVPSWVAMSRELTPVVNGVNGTIPQGFNCFCQGLPGSPGVQGPPGASITGAQGQPGQPGPTGAAGICIADPTCQRGATGPTGPTGATGPQGVQGLTGLSGATGPAGPSGPSGARGVSGPTGATGPQGIPGVNGTCDCFNLPEVTIGNIVNTGELNILGNITCSNTTSFAQSCFPNACLNFSACDLQSRSLLLTDGSPTFLKVCTPGDNSNCQVIFGDNSTGNATNPDRMALFRSFSLQTIFDSQILTQITTLAGDMVVRALGGLGSRLTLASSGQVNVAAAGDVIIESNGAGSVTLTTQYIDGRVNLQAPGGIFGVGDSFNMTSQTYSFTSGGTDIYLAGTPNTLTCQASLPLPVDTGGNKNELRQDMVTYNGAQIISGESSGILSIGPIVSICGDRIIAPGGTLTIDGDIFSTGTISSTGACCTSDERVKRNITILRTQHMLTMVNELRPVTFDWSDEYVAHDAKAKYEPRNRLGFVAQELRKTLPQAVTTLSKRIGTKTYDDFHTVDMNSVVPVLVGAIQELTRRLDEQQAEIAELRKRVL